MLSAIYVELIAEAFKSVNGYDHCNGAILLRIKFRQMKKVNSKHHLTKNLFFIIYSQMLQIVMCSMIRDN